MFSTTNPEIKPVDEKTNAKLLKAFEGEKTGWVQIGPKNYLMPSKFILREQEIREFKTRKDDTWICTFPRSGTTMTQEMSWLIANNFDFDTARSQLLSERFPFFEFELAMHEDTKQVFIKENLHSPRNIKIIEDISYPLYKALEDVPSPRFIKTHLPPSLLPQDIWDSGAKIIYVARNPKDVAISYYHLSRLWRTTGFVESFSSFWDFFEKGLVAWGPYWSHIKEGWQLRDKHNFLFLFYENIIEDMAPGIRKISQFLGKNASDNQISALIQHLNVDNFKHNPAVNFEFLRDVKVLSDWNQPFIRIGQNGVKSVEYTQELEARANKWIETNYKETDLRFPVKKTKISQ